MNCMFKGHENLFFSMTMSEGVAHYFLPKLELFWLIHMRDFCIFLFVLAFSHCFEVGGFSLENMNIPMNNISMHQSEFSNIWIKIWPKPQPVCPHQADQLSYWVSNPFSDIDFDCCLVIYKWIFIVMEKYFETKFSGAFSSCESYEKTFCHFNRAPCSEDTPSVYCSGQLLSLSFSRRRLLKPEVWQNVVCHMLATLFLVYYS